MSHARSPGSLTLALSCALLVTACGEPETRWRGSPRLVPELSAREGSSDLLKAREAVWRAWFENRQTELQKLVPADVIAINPGDSVWRNRDGVIAGSRDFEENGGELISLEFPRTEIQEFGLVAILYSTYRMKYTYDGSIHEIEGRATEVFVRTDAGWENPGWHLDSGS